ncbi:hypothetical protein K7X08_006350 [Anisodus acutangulus]|uniref:Uncharacterized protein n=1 Tax=Anisodus acutangulus TaxID=402998 RepID=A0A9Q1RRW7_9SOLA|nr:hypothetical protein K7X08_006350 [Anisodus acutangulus]
MAKECDKLESALFFTLNRSSKIKEVKHAEDHIASVYLLLWRPEKFDPENKISAQLEPLFLESYDVYHAHIKDQGRTGATIGMFSEVIKIIKPESIAEIIKASRSEATTKAKFLCDFVSALQEDLEHLLSHDASLKVAFDGPFQWLKRGLETSLVARRNWKARIAPREDLTNYVLEEMIFLRTLSMDALEQCKEQTKITDFLTLIQSVSEQVTSHIVFANSYSKEEDLTRKINHLHFKLVLRYKFINAVIRQMSPGISASSIVDLPKKNLLNFLPINFGVIDSYISMLKSSKTSSSGYPKMDLVLMGFHEYILDNLMLKCETKMTFTNVDEVKMFYHGLLLLVTYFIDPLVQCIGLKKQNSLLTGFETMGIESYEAYADSNKSWTANLVLHFLTEAFKLVEYEGRQHIELTKLHDLLKNSKVTVHKLAQIRGAFYESFINGSSTEKTRLLLSDYLHRIESVKDRMLNDDVGLIFCIKNQISLVKEKQVYFDYFLADIVQYRNMHQELKDLMRRVQDIKYVCLFSIRSYTPAWYYMLYLSDAKQLLKFVEAEVKMICLKVPDSSGYYFPKTNGLGFLNCILGKLDELLHYKLDSIIDLKHQIESVKEGILCLRSLTDHFAESYDEHDEVYNLITSVTEMAYKEEYVTDSCLTLSHPLWYKVLWMSEVVENIKLVIKIVGEACEKFPELKYLNLDNINISQWSVSDDSFPKLERLVLTKCKQLEEIPSHFGDAISLKRIEVNRCGCNSLTCRTSWFFGLNHCIKVFAFEIFSSKTSLEASTSPNSTLDFGFKNIEPFAFVEERAKKLLSFTCSRINLGIKQFDVS